MNNACDMVGNATSKVPTPAGADNPTEAAAPGGPPRILCADDEPAIRSNMASALVRTGFLVATVSDGRTAWKMIRAEPFDLLITDQDMPEMSGEELVRKLRAQGHTLPVIVISASPELFFTSRNRWLGVAGVLPKPFSLRELVSMTRRVLNLAAPDSTQTQTAPKQTADSRLASQPILTVAV
jgi:DNA-binding response OmpR family regulator